MPGTDEAMMDQVEDGTKPKSVALDQLVQSKPLTERVDVQDMPVPADVPPAEAGIEQAETAAKLLKGKTTNGSAQPRSISVTGTHRPRDVEVKGAKLKASMIKQATKTAMARFEAALNKVDQGQAVVRLVDAELGPVEANIILTGNDLTVRLRAEDSVSRQGLAELLSEIKKEIKAANLVSGDVDVEEEHGSQDDDQTPPDSDHASSNYEDESELRSRLARLA